MTLEEMEARDAKFLRKGNWLVGSFNMLAVVFLMCFGVEIVTAIDGHFGAERAGVAAIALCVLTLVNGIMAGHFLSAAAFGSDAEQV